MSLCQDGLTIETASILIMSGMNYASLVSQLVWLPICLDAPTASPLSILE